MSDARAVAAAFLRQWQAWPPIAAARAAFDGCAPDDAERALAAIDALFADPGWAEATIAALAAAARADAGFVPPFAALGEGVQAGLLLIEHPIATVSLAVVPRDLLGARKAAAAGAGTIGFSGAITRYRVLRGAGATLQWWTRDPIDGSFDAGGAGLCRATETQALRDGDWLLVDGRRDGFIVTAAAGDLVLLQATLAPGRAPLRIDHDAQTLRFAAASATDPAASHRQMMATLLRILGRADAVPALAAMADDPAFFVRWHAARELALLDAAAARPVLARLTADVRADIAAAATAALAMLGDVPDHARSGAADMRACPA